MAPNVWERRSLQLTPEQWARLEQLAAESNSVAPRGPTFRQPAWRTLIKRLADGDFVLTPRRTPASPLRHQDGN